MHSDIFVCRLNYNVYLDIYIYKKDQKNVVVYNIQSIYCVKGIMYNNIHG